MNTHLLERLTVAAILVGLPLVAPAQAQFVNQAAARWYVGGAMANGMYGGAYNAYGGWGGGGTTAAESYQRGMADVMRARGEYDYYRAKASKEYEDARSVYIDNQTKWLAAYNQRKRMGQAQRQQEQAERRDAINRGRSARAAAREQDLPVPSQIDPDTGQVDWPDVLQEPRYSEETEKLNSLLGRWAAGEDASILAPEVVKAAEMLQSQLHTNIRDYPANDFIDADRLLTSIQQLAGSHSPNL